MRNKLFILSSLLSLLFCYGNASAAEFCDDQYYINQSLPNGATWDMCWTQDDKQGIRYHHIYYQPKDETRRMVLFDASIAQIHVPYDDNGARYHDVSDFGLGADNLVSLQQSECNNGDLGYYNSKPAVCKQVINGGAAYRSNTSTKEQSYLKLFSISDVGEYLYSSSWKFYGDGRILPSIEATGSLQRFGGLDKEQHGWLMADGAIGLAHMHNFFWRLDFDLDGSGSSSAIDSNDTVQEINYSSYQGKRYRELTTFTQEQARSVNPTSMRSWLIKDNNTTNSKGHNISYEVRLNQAGQREIGPTFEQFTYNDFFVSKAKSCERIASHNQRVFADCSTDSLNEFVNGESIEGQDIVAWVGVSFYHMPRAEDAPYMDSHESTFEIIPRGWHTSNPMLDEAPTTQLRLSASEDTATTDNKNSVLIDVLSNDTGSNIVFNTLDDPNNGTARIVNNQVEYTPDAGFVGVDSFWYSIKDSTGTPFGTKIYVTVTEPQVSSSSVNSSGGGGSFSGRFMFLLSLFGFYVWFCRKYKH
jgi:Cu2+-containing amine oxidase